MKSWWINKPQTLLLLSRRGPRGPNTRLSQHYICPKMVFFHSSNFFRKKFLWLDKKKSCTFLYTFGGYNFPKSCEKTSWFIHFLIHSIGVGNFFFQARKLFLQIFEKLQNSILSQRNVDSLVSGHLGLLLLKSGGIWECFFSKNFSGATLLVFWGI